MVLPRVSPPRGGDALCCACPSPTSIRPRCAIRRSARPPTRFDPDARWRFPRKRRTRVGHWCPSGRLPDRSASCSALCISVSNPLLPPFRRSLIENTCVVGCEPNRRAASPEQAGAGNASCYHTSIEPVADEATSPSRRPARVPCEVGAVRKRTAAAVSVCPRLGAESTVDSLKTSAPS